MSRNKLDKGIQSMFLVKGTSYAKKQNTFKGTEAVC